MERDLFEIPGPGPYLLAHSVGCLPARARATFESSVLAPWASEGADGWPGWLAAIDRFRDVLADLIGARAEHICPQPGVSAALSNLLSALPHAPGRDRLIASRHAFPSIGFAMRSFERFGYRLDLIEGDPSDPAIWQAAIGADTAAVVAMHVHSNSGLISPIKEISAMARRTGAVMIVDIAQSAGILPIDVTEWDVGAVIGSCVKWLCGGPGAGFLWVSPELIEHCRPLHVGWFSHENPFAYDIDDFRPAPDARRFWGGTPSIAPYVLATVGIETVAALGVARILADNRRLIAHFAAAAGVAIDMTGRGGTLCLRTARPDHLAAALTSAGCRFDRRDDITRLSFHSWNDEGEAGRVGRAVKDFAVALA